MTEQNNGTVIARQKAKALPKQSQIARLLRHYLDRILAMTVPSIASATLWFTASQ